MLSTSLLSTSTAPKWMKNLSDDIELILESAEKVDRCREDLHNAYINWLRISDDTIRTIRNIRDGIVRANRKSNYVHVGGASGGIAGGILGLVGRVASIPDRETLLHLMGGVLAATGTIFSVGSNITRNAVTKRLCTKAAENLETNKRYTTLFEKEYKRYFDALRQFDSFFKTVGGNDVALSLFYQFADDEEFGLLDDLGPSRWSKNKVRSALQKIIESDVTELVPRMWSSEFLRYSDSDLKSLGEKIRNRLASLKTYIENDPYLSRLFCDKLRNFLMEEFRHTDKPELENALQILSTLRVGERVAVGKCNYLNMKVFLIEMSDVIHVGLMAYFVSSVSPIFIIIGLVDLIKSLLNHENGSQSDESKNITEILNDLKGIRKDVIHQMEKHFEW